MSEFRAGERVQIVGIIGHSEGIVVALRDGLVLVQPDGQRQFEPFEPERLEHICTSCAEGVDQKCPRSRLGCEHHCEHSWSHDRCCWCGRTWAESN